MSIERKHYKSPHSESVQMESAPLFQLVNYENDSDAETFSNHLDDASDFWYTENWEVNWK